ncbi:MAG: hypothetical protein IIA67_01325 [Planctomycetes bacterium]|nr:hypothetical protein [Planctomycetota bacterium]
MRTTDYTYWPFSVEPAASRSPQETEKVEFFETACDNGYESFRFGINDYGARSQAREGCILERGRNKWEIRLAEGEQRRLSAFVDDFKSAGQAIQQWLDGSPVRRIVHDIHDRLITPPGAEASYVIDGRIRG